MLEIQQTLAINGHNAQFKGKGLLMCCPYHNDHNPSLQVFQTGYKCYSCEASGPLTKLYIDLGIESAPRPDLLKATLEKLSKTISTNLHCLVGLPDASSFTGDYRGVKSEIYLANEAFTTEADSIGFPLYDLDSKYRGYVKNVYGGKYINNFTSGYVPFGLQRLNANAPIIVEGIFDALSVQQLGYKNVIAILGTGQIWNVAKILRQIKAANVHILMDSDDAGIYAAKKLSDMYRSSKIISIEEPNKDPNNYEFLKGLMETEYALPS